MVAGLFAFQPARAEPSQDERSVLILALVMSYDRAMPTRAPGGVVVGVVYDPSHAGSAAEAEATLAVFADMPDVRIFGRPLSAVALPADKVAEGVTNVHALFLCAGLDNRIADILAVSRATDRLTLTTHSTWVDQGVSVGVRWDDGNGTIRVNRPASRLEGADLGSELLNLAEVIRGSGG